MRNFLKNMPKLFVNAPLGGMWVDNPDFDSSSKMEKTFKRLGLDAEMTAKLIKNYEKNGIWRNGYDIGFQLGRLEGMDEMMDEVKKKS